MIERAWRFVHLTRRQQGLLVRAAVLLVAIRIGLRTLPFAKIRWGVDRLARPGAGSRGTTYSPREIAWAVTLASARLPGTTLCLPQALAAHVLLRRSGRDSELRIGVARSEDGRLLAHAWVESAGSVVVGGAVDQYTALGTRESIGR